MAQNSGLIESLLFEEEGTELDFKREQYPFEGAGNEEKSELLKDILAFANAFRRSDAYILIGVEEVKGGRSKVTGVSSQLDDAKLQQFVNAKLQRPVTFSYREAIHDGLPIGIIHIPVQLERPYYSTKEFGIVKKGAVYLRQGSATEAASGDQIAQMGKEQAAPQNTEPSFELAIIDGDTEQEITEGTALRSTWLELPEGTQIPDYQERRDRYGVGSLHGVNRDYYRKLVEYSKARHALSRIVFFLKNTGRVTAHDVRLVFKVDDPEERFGFCPERRMPSRPQATYNYYVDRLSDTFNVGRSDVYVSRAGNEWQVECSFGKIQPQDEVSLADSLYVGAREDGTLSVEAQIYADNISAPQQVRLTLNFETETKTVSLEDIRNMDLELFLKTEEGQELLAEMRSESDN